MQLVTENKGMQTVCRLIDDSLDDVVGEAVISETSNEVRLHGIFVKREHRGKGYGEALMQAILNLSEAKLITLCTGLGNIAFFKRYGFTITDVGDSLVSMERQL